MLRILVSEHPENPAYSLALEEALYYSVAKLNSPPILRIWRHSNAIVLGYFQKAEEEIHLEKAMEYNVNIVRRITGGGAVYHDYGCLLWSVITRGPVNGGTRFIYDYLLKGFVNFLRIYTEAKIENVNDIVVSGRKVSGTSATFDRRGAFLLHGTLLLKTNLERLTELLKVPKSKLLDKGVSEVKYRVANLYEVIGKEIPIYELIEKLIKAYSDLLREPFVLDVPSEREYKIAEYLYREKYSKKEWNLQRKRIDLDIDFLINAQ